jgi:hypothetical protein
MKLKNDKIKKLQKKVDELKLDLSAINEEYKLYCVPKNKDGTEIDWFNYLPIETLLESLNKDHGKPRIKYSLSDFHHNFKLFNLYIEKFKEYSELNSKLNIAKINKVLNEIKDIKI